MTITTEIVDLADLTRAGASPQSGGSQTGPGSPGNTPPGQTPGGGGGFPPGGGGGSGGGSAPPGLGLWLWVGIVDNDRLTDGTGGFTHADLVAYGVEGIFVSNNTDVRDYSPAATFIIDELAAAKAAGLKVGYGAYCARGHPPNNASERAAWLAGWSLVVADGDDAGVDTFNSDMEDYERDTPGGWDGSDHAAMYAMGQDWADILGARTMCVYPSSRFSWDDSNNDEILFQAEGVHYYNDNRAVDLVGGFFDHGGSMTLLDASFHFGKQNSIPSSLADGVDRMVDLTVATFPDATAAPMFWPDNSERAPGPPGSFYSPEEAGYMLSSSNGHATGPTVFYQHHLTGGVYTSQWRAFLSQIAGNI